MMIRIILEHDTSFKWQKKWRLTLQLLCQPGILALIVLIGLGDSPSLALQCEHR
jgi:hypothetical protein